MKTQQTIADEHGIHPNQVLRWKQRLIERSGELFEQSCQYNAARDELQKQLTEAQKTIEQLQGEVEFMKRVITAESSRNLLQFVESNHRSLSVTQQCKLLGVSRSSYYAESHKDSREQQDVADVLIILEVLRELPLGVEVFARTSLLFRLPPAFYLMTAVVAILVIAQKKVSTQQQSGEIELPQSFRG